MRQLYWLVAAAILGCGKDAGGGQTVLSDRAREQQNCESISQTGREASQCLVLKYNWNADSATPAGARFQWMVDSLRLEHERQARIILAAQEARAESLRVREQIAGARRAAPWVSCILDRWKTGHLGGNSIEVLPLQLYGPCKELLPSTADYYAYQASHRLTGDTDTVVGHAFVSSDFDRKGLGLNP